MRSRFILLLTSLVWVSILLRPLAGQSPSSSGGAWVVAPRYASDGEGAVFAGRVESRWIAGEEFTFDVRERGWALGIGAGPRFLIGPVHFSVLAGPVADLPRWYAGLYIAPSYHSGRVSAGGTIELFAPLTHGAVGEYELSHARVFLWPSTRVQVGAFVHLVREGSEWARFESGPSLRMTLADGLSVTGDAAKGFAHTPSIFLLTAEWAP